MDDSAPLDGGRPIVLTAPLTETDKVIPFTTEEPFT